MLTIHVPDMLRRSVEAASGGKNTVMYTAKEQPCFMVVIPRFDVEDIDSELGTGPHPAFVVGGVTKSEIFVGQHIGHQLNGEMVSIPGVDPIRSVNHDQVVALARANGPGWHAMTNAEWAALQLWCWKNGFQPRGNNDYGRDHAATDEVGVRQDGVAPGVSSGSARTLTGSGPASWRHDNTPFGVCDLNGNVWEWCPGMRIVDGEIQVLPNNDAALDDADLTAGSTAWRAIDGESGDLVTPGDEGVVRYATSGTADYSLVLGDSTPFQNMTNPGSTPVSATALAVCQRLGLYPIAPTGLGGDRFYVNTEGERLPRRGGHWGHASSAGVFALNVGGERSNSSTVIGARPALIL